MMVPGTTLRGPRNSRPSEEPVRAPATTEARTRSSGVGGWSSRGCSGAPRDAFHQFSRPVESRSELRIPQNVLPMANHCAPETMAKSEGVDVRSVP